MDVFCKRTSGEPSPVSGVTQLQNRAIPARGGAFGKRAPRTALEEGSILRAFPCHLDGGMGLGCKACPGQHQKEQVAAAELCGGLQWSGSFCHGISKEVTRRP